jgi:hypothetical protein
MSPPKKPFLNPAARDSIHDRRTELVKDMVAKENAANDAKTERLRALRLAKEAAEPPPPVKKAAKKKP